MDTARAHLKSATLLSTLAFGMLAPWALAGDEPPRQGRTPREGGTARVRRPVGALEDLFTAAMLGNLPAVKALLQEGVPTDFLHPHPSDPEALSPLAAAAGEGFVEIVKTLLDAKADVNFSNAGGETPIMYAARGGAPVTEVLIAAGADVNRVDKNGMSAVMRAIAGESGAETLPLFLKAGADPNVRQKEGATALMVAAKNGKADLVTILAKGGADLEATYMTQQFTALIMASTMKRAGAVEALLAAGAKVDHAAGGGLTPLMAAAASGEPRVLDLLLAAGADPKRKADNGMTALDAAKQNGNAAAVEKLTAAIAR